MLNMKKIVPPVVGALAGAIIVGGVWYGTHAASGQSSIVATVGGTPITQKQLAAETQSYAGSQMLSQLITNQLVMDAAAKQKITASQAEINQSLQSIEQQNGITSEAQLTQLLASSNMTKTQLMSELKVSVLEKKIAESQVKVTPEEIQTFYNQNKSSLGTPEQRALSDIIVATQAQAQQVKAQIASGTSFTNLVKKYSTDTATKDNGGSLGTFTQAELQQTNPTIVTAAFGLKSGEVSAPVKVSTGYELVQVTKITPAKVPTLAQAKGTITAAIKQQNATPAATLTAQLMKTDNVEILDKNYTSVKTQMANPPSTSSTGQ